MTYPGAVCPNPNTIAGAQSNQVSPPRYPSPWGTGAGDWAPAYEKAIALVSQLTLEEKVNLTTGQCLLKNPDQDGDVDTIFKVLAGSSSRAWDRQAAFPGLASGLSVSRTRQWAFATLSTFVFPSDRVWPNRLTSEQLRFSFPCRHQRSCDV